MAAQSGSTERVNEWPRGGWRQLSRDREPLEASLAPCDSALCLLPQRALVETHLRQICGLEQQLRQQQGLRDAAFPSLSPPPAPAAPCADLDLHYLALRGGSALGHGEISATPLLLTPRPGAQPPLQHHRTCLAS